MSELSRRWLAPQLEATAMVACDLPEAPAGNLNTLVLARTMAATIVGRAEDQAREALQLAQAEGLRRGLEEAERVLAERLAQFEAVSQRELQEEMVRLSSVFGDAHSRMWQEVTESLSSVVLTLARKLVGEQLEATPELLLPGVREALSEFSSTSEVTLRLHTDDLERLRERLPQAPGLRLVEDGNLARGDFYVEGAQGSVDGRLDTRVNRLEIRLKQAG